jgi:large subunit ribosomal protein L3
MAGFTLAEKLDQSQMFDETGKRIPVTLLKTTSCYLIDVKWPEVNNYMAVTLGFGQSKTAKKSVQGQLNKAGIKTPLRFLKELRLDKMGVTKLEEEGKAGIQIGEAKLFIGEEVKSDLLFKVGDLVRVSGTSKGKGFAGVVKRHGFAGGPKTHGQSDRWRAPGSAGQSTTPGRVYKGKRMAGRMGTDRVSVQNLKVVKVDEAGITLKGVVPGHKHGLIEVITM